ncbi:BZIP domain-containing protein [Pseudozyma hubeiensis]|nr:BZIP domain-containing protein [Pseudozyma hubeiensis]
MRPPIKPTDDEHDAERVRQIARRKEQNRNAQRRLRERKEEYTMQLEVQLAELHRRSQSQEEESHLSREALARMRAENQTLAEQIAMIHQAVPSTQSSHPLPQRASIDLGVDHFAPLNRHRNRSQSVTALALPHLTFGHAAAPWSTSSQEPIPAMHAPFGATIAPGATHRMPFPTVSPLPATSSFGGGLAAPHHDAVEDVSMARPDDNSRASSHSPALSRRTSSLISTFDPKSNFSRHDSGQTEVTLPSEQSEPGSSASGKLRRVSDFEKPLGAAATTSPSPPIESAAIPSRTMAPAASTAVEHGSSNTSKIALSSDEVMASCLESIHSLPQAHVDAHASQKSNVDNAASWMSSAHDFPGQLALPDFRHSDMSNMSKPLGITPGALGLTNVMSGTGASSDGWSISPWINMGQTPTANSAVDMGRSASRPQADAHSANSLDAGMSFENKNSLASRRGFSGSLKFEYAD